jgi:katanin p80 WD40 repeat-containing subunit B1
MFPISSKFDQSKIRLHEFVAHSTAVNCLCIGKKSYQVLATGGEDFKTNVWRIGNAANIWMLGCNKSPIECVCFDADEQCLVTGAMNGSIKVFDLNLGKLARNLGGHQVNTCTIQYHPYGEFIVSGSIDSTLKVWDVRNRACIQTFTGHDKEVTCARFSPDGRWVSSSSKDGTILIWDLVASKLLSTIKLAPTYVTTFEFNPAEFVLAAATSSRTVKLWDLDTMEVIRTTNADSQPIKSIAFSNDGLNIYSATRNSLKKWNWNNGCKLITSNDMSWENVNELHITTENKALAGACNCNFVSIWSVDLNVNPSVMKNPTDNIQKNDRNSNGLARVNSISNQKLSNETDSSPRPRNRNNSDGREEKNSRNDIYAPVSDYSPASAKAAATAHEINQLLEERDSKNGEISMINDDIFTADN